MAEFDFGDEQESDDYECDACGASFDSEEELEAHSKVCPAQ